MRLSAQIKTELTNRLRDNADKLVSALNKTFKGIKTFERIV